MGKVIGYGVSQVVGISYYLVSGSLLVTDEKQRQEVFQVIEN